MLNSILILYLISLSTTAETIEASIYYIKQTRKYIVKKGKYDEKAIAFGKYIPLYHEKGWDFLTISTYQGRDNKYSDHSKSYAMGYLEGVLTADRIYAHWINMNHFKYYNNNVIMPNLTHQFFKENLDYVKYKSTALKDTNQYWYEAYNLYRQMLGLHDVYNSVVSDEKKIDLINFQTVISVGDLDEILYWKNPNARPDYSKMTISEIKDFINLHSHCSSLIKVAPDFSDIWFGHNTWTAYNKMIRIFKEYKYIPNPGHEVKSNVISMSSYPGAINSQDDFYITSADLYVAETTNHIFNNDLWELLTPKSLMCWMRTMLANRLSDNSKFWAEIFQIENSGTYNNQFQILDLKKINITGQVIADGALYILEQIPGYCGIADVTKTLRYGYWPSYNTPYLKEVRNISGYDLVLKERPELYDSIDYSGCARANLFRKYQGNVKDIDSYKKLLRFDDYKNEPLAKGDPGNVIAERADLYKETQNVKPRCYGCTDLKFASIKDVLGKINKKIYLINGPPSETNEPFNWNDTTCVKYDTNKWANFGQVKLYNFTMIEYNTTLM